jgi:hypothetical protein
MDKDKFKSLYKRWANMKMRCLNKKTPNYCHYGGRGIGVCEKWLNFAGFYEDMWPNFETNLTLDRIDNSRGYCKDNCRWASYGVQENNKRINRLIEWRGITRNLTQWANCLGIKKSTLRQRYYVYHWNIDKCLGYKGGQIGTR